jgi:ribosomal protein S19
MKRSKWKSTKLNSLKSYRGREVFYNRNTIIDPSMVNKEFRVDTGNSFKVIKITTDHVSHRLGEFAPTKVKATFKKSKNN